MAQDKFKVRLSLRKTQQHYNWLRWLWLDFLGEGFIFQQDRAPAHTAQRMQDFLQQNCSDFTQKDNWPPNSRDINPLDFYVWGVMLDRYQKYQPKPQDIAELKTAAEDLGEFTPRTRSRSRYCQLRSACQHVWGLRVGILSTCSRSKSSNTPFKTAFLRAKKQKN